MSPSRATRSRAAEVRRAAAGWRKAGVIDASALTAIEAAYPDGRLRLAMAWKVVIFIVVSVAINAILFAFEMVSHRGEASGSWLTFAALLAVATEMLLGNERIGDNGSAAATSFWAAVYALVGAAFLFLGGASRNAERAETVTLLVATVVFAAACWRWGFELYGVFSAVALFFLLARFPGGRLWWVIAGAALILACARELDRAALPPPLRRACAGVLAVSGLALYAAFNRYTLEERLIEAVAGARPDVLPQPWHALLVLSPLAMAAIPLLFVAWGLQERRLLFVDLGVVLAAFSLVTLRYYVHLAPLWLLLSMAGAVLVGAALVLNRRLRLSPNGEWAGFTARPLYSGRSMSGLGTAAVVAAYAPDAAPPAPEGGFIPGGGRFGGGGADGSF